MVCCVHCCAVLVMSSYCTVLVDMVSCCYVLVFVSSSCVVLEDMVSCYAVL